MRPALYYPWVYLKGGAERVLLQLMKSSRHDWTLYTNHFDLDGTFPEFQQYLVIELSRVSVRRNAFDVAGAARPDIDRRQILGIVLCRGWRRPQNSKRKQCAAET